MPCRLQLCGITDQPNAGKVFIWHGIYERRFLQSYYFILSYENSVINHGSKVSPKIKYIVQIRRRNL